MNKIFNCPYRCGDICTADIGKLADEDQRAIMDEYRLQYIYQYVKDWERSIRQLQIILAIQSIAIIATATALITTRLT